jgi:hypothetical protein
VQLLRSHLHLQACTARVERQSASFGSLPASFAVMAHSAQSSLLLRQVSSVFNRIVQVRAPLPLRLLFLISNGALPVNKANNPDAASRAGF